MMVYRRISSNPYKIKIECESIKNIAGKIKTVPPQYINEEKNNVTDACLGYIAPLVAGEPKLLYRNGIQRFFKL
jgi:6-phosphofructokinase 1